MEAWYAAGAADGFNLMFPVLPIDLVEFAELVSPELQRRGLTPREEKRTYAQGIRACYLAGTPGAAAPAEPLQNLIAGWRLPSISWAIA